MHALRLRPPRAALRRPAAAGLATAAAPSPARAAAPRVAVVGAGPAGFYTAHRLLKDHPALEVDVYERLPAPFGLVRYGVAPDHPDVKNVIHKFDEVAQSPRFAFFGNVAVGDLSGAAAPSISLSELRAKYAAVVVTSGATASDNAFGVPGEDSLRNVLSARAFVGWYNGLPEFANLPVDLQAGDTAVVFGQGNVALDVARVLLSPVDALRGTDMAEHALEALAKSKVRNVRVVGRRGPLQVAFTAKELRELLALPSTAFHIDAPLLASEMAANADALAADRPRKRLLGILEKAAKAAKAPTATHTDRAWSLDFLRSPTAFLPSSTDPTAVGSVRCAINQLVDGRAVAVPGKEESLPCALAVKSIGYRAAPIDTTLAFDARRAIVPHDGTGRVMVAAEDPIKEPLFVAGWLKRGPTGVIASTMWDAYETAGAVLKAAPELDAAAASTSGKLRNAAEARAWLEQDKGMRVIDWAAWGKIRKYEAEVLKGSKVVKVDDMLRIALDP